MPSAKQIAARKAFARKYAKKGKRKAKSKKPKSPKYKPASRIGKKIYESMTSQEQSDFDEKWDKKMKEFLHKENNES